MDHTRRQFINTAMAAGALGALGADAQGAPPTTSAGATGVPRRALGRTGVDVSMLALGGWHIGAVARKDRNQAIAIMHRAIEEGLTFFDNAWDYHDGLSEEVMGEALAAAGKRERVFLMTKNCERDYQGSLRNLEDSLRRLKTDHLDLWQFHEICYDNDPDWVFEKGGLKAALEARKAGKVRFIGFTGHKHPDIHLKMLAKPHPWDTCQMPISAFDASYRSFQRAVLPVCRKKGVAPLGMKSLGGGGPPRSTILERRKDLNADQLISFSLSQPIASLVTGMTSMADLEQNLRIARAWKPMSAGDRQALLAKIADDAGDGHLEVYKSTQAYDGPHHRKQHGFEG